MQHYFLCTKVDSAKRELIFSNGKKTIVRKIFAAVKIDNGVLYLSGDTKVAVWECDVLGRPFDETDNKETWSSPDLRNSRKNFVDMCDLLTSKELS